MKTSERTVRAMVAAIPLLAAAVTAVALLGWRRRLPDPVATHFPVAALADGSTGRNLFCWMMINIVALIAIIGAVATWRCAGRSVVAGWGGLTAFLAWLLTALAVWTVVRQSDVDDWRTVAGPSLVGFSAILIVSLTAGVAACALALRLPRTTANPNLDRPRLGLASTEIAAWSRRQHILWPLGVAAAGVAAALIGAITLAWPVIVAGIAVTFVGVWMSSIRVDVDRRGLSVGWGPLLWPTTRIPLDHIAHATVADVRPRQWGGWGYRGSLRMLGRAAAVLRAGDGIIVELHDGRRFAVTVDDAATGAGLLNDLVGRADDQTG